MGVSPRRRYTALPRDDAGRRHRSVREVVLDTETTGLEVAHGHRVIEIAGVELLDGRPTGQVYHRYLNPDRPIESAATAVHGLTDADVAHAPRFRDVGLEFLQFVHGATIVAHHAEFDLAFLDAELRAAGSARGFEDFIAGTVDSLALARTLLPGQRHDLESLGRHFGISTAHRKKHGARVDAELLAAVYRALRVSQGELGLASDPPTTARSAARPAESAAGLRVIPATPDELAAHERFLDRLDQHCPGGSVWRRRGPSMRY